MNIMLAKENLPEKVEMRQVYCDTLIEMSEADDRVVVLDADLMTAMGTLRYAKRFPDRTINCGIQEANMIGVAAGLSAAGKIPFAHTFAAFASRRALDQVFISGAYAKLNIKIIGSDPGITAALNGGTHMSFEDLGIMRAIPQMTVIEPADSSAFRDILKKIKDVYGMFYVRLVRKNAIKIYEEGSTFEIGKSVLLKNGSDITIIAAGFCVAEALEAARMLEAKGISARVIDMFTIKPIDKEAVIKSARETGAVVTAENHNIINGLGSAVAEVLGEHMPVPMGRIGIKDSFGEVGPVDYLKKRFEITAQDIAAKAEEVLRRKYQERTA